MKGKEINSEQEEAFYLKKKKKKSDSNTTHSLPVLLQGIFMITDVYKPKHFSKKS